MIFRVILKFALGDKEERSDSWPDERVLTDNLLFRQYILAVEASLDLLPVDIIMCCVLN